MRTGMNLTKRFFRLGVVRLALCLGVVLGASGATLLRPWHRPAPEHRIASYTYSLNNTPSTGAVAMYAIYAQLHTAGWSDKADSDGTTYAASGGQVTSG